MNYKWGSEIKKKGSDGMSNAAIETFRAGDVLAGFVRELVQNSQDARLDNEKPLKINIRLFSIEKSQIPGFNTQWTEIFDAVKEKWMGSYPGFFDKAKRILLEDKITVLEYSDYNCTGLSGLDDNDNGSFSACVLSEGNSAEKSDDAGGSYGIGKNAVFSLSGIRTVLYSSANTSGEAIFQGVSKLASYIHNGENYGSRVYLGNDDEKLSSVRDECDIPEVFRRKKSGLSQFVIGVEFNNNWIEELTNLVIDNYFLLFHNSNLIFTVSDELSGEEKKVVLDNSNFECHASDSFKKIEESETTARAKHVWPKICSLKKRSVVKDVKDSNGGTLPNGFVVHFSNDFDFGQNFVSYTRRGMQIYTEKLHHSGGIGYLNLVGVFYSESKEVNAVLRLMEPAAHNAWNLSLLKDRLKEDMHVEWALSLTKKIKDFVRESAKEHLKEVSMETHTIAEVDELLKLGSNPSSVFKRGTVRSGETDPETETALKTGTKYEVNLYFSSGEDNIVEGEFIDQVRKPSTTKNGNSRKRQSPKGGAGTIKSPRIKNLVQFSYSCILKEETKLEREYSLILSSEEPNFVDIELYQAGDQGVKLKAEVLSAAQDGRDIIVDAVHDRTVLRDIEIKTKSIVDVKIKSMSKAGVILELH